jgi:hypothetical protein
MVAADGNGLLRSNGECIKCNFEIEKLGNCQYKGNYITGNQFQNFPILLFKIRLTPFFLFFCLPLIDAGCNDDTGFK